MTKGLTDRIIENNTVRSSIGVGLILFGFSFAANWSAQNVFSIVDKISLSYSFVIQAVIVLLGSATAMFWGVRIIKRNEVDHKKEIKS